MGWISTVWRLLPEERLIDLAWWNWPIDAVTRAIAAIGRVDLEELMRLRDAS